MKRFVIISCLLLACAASAIIILANPDDALTSTTVTITQGDNAIKASGLLPKFDLDDLISGDTIAVIATVNRIAGSSWNEDVPGSPMIHTDVIINVDRYIGTELPYEQLVIRVLGGRIGNDVMVYDVALCYQRTSAAVLVPATISYGAHSGRI